MSWQYFNHHFEYEKPFPDLAWPWAGHKYFIYDLIRNIKPQLIVELGTHRGTSFFSMCQSVKDARLDTKLNAVDTWQGDKHTGFYDETIYNEVIRIKKLYYNKQNIVFLKTTFDQAQKQFKNGSIDLLHIDGLHTYKAVKHDFNNWLPKVNPSGVIVLHDIAEKKEDFGVYKLWADIKKGFETTIEFTHSHGLGIMFLDKKYFSLKEKNNYWQIYYPAVYQNKLSPFSERLQIQLDQQTAISNEYLRQLTIIKSAKFYQLWQKYCSIKKSILQ